MSVSAPKPHTAPLARIGFHRPDYTGWTLRQLQDYANHLKLPFSAQATREALIVVLEGR